MMKMKEHDEVYSDFVSKLKHKYKSTKKKGSYNKTIKQIRDHYKHKKESLYMYSKESFENGDWIGICTFFGFFIKS